MKKNISLLVFTLFFSAFSAQEFEKNQLIVKFKKQLFNKQKVNLAQKTLGFQSIDQLNAEYSVDKISPIGNPENTSSYLLEFKNDTDINAVYKVYKNDVNVEYAEPNYIAHGAGVRADQMISTAPNDTYFYRQWSLYNPGTFTASGMSTTADADVDMDLAWDIETGDPNMIIAVSDTGLNMSHEDISPRLWNKTAEIIDGIDNDGNGFIDDYKGWDYVNNDNDPTDDHGHGTNCIGILGSAANNGKGYAGVNWNSKIMPLKVLNSSNSGTYLNMANSLYYAADNGAKIISMSIGGSSPSSLLWDAINYLKARNILLVVCMMNNNNETPNYPAAYSVNFDNLIAVGSTDADDKRTQPFFWSATSGSNFGNHINVVAPGNYIYGLGISSSTAYNNYWGGTSQATPLVAGIASLILSKKPTLTPSQIRNIIQTTAEDQKGLSSEDTPGFDKYYGWGRVNAYHALSSPLLKADEIKSNAGLQIMNPVSNNEVEIYSNAQLVGAAAVTLLNFEGRQLLKENIQIRNGKNSIPIKGVIPGNYILTVETSAYKKVFKISVK